MKIWTVARKDLAEALNSPVAYVLFIIFALVTGYFFSQPLFLVKQANLAPFLDLVPLILVFLVPAVTMRSFAEEYRSGTHEIWMTLPLKTYEVVLGKFAAAWALVGLSVAATLVYPFVLELLGDPDWGAIAGAYLGHLFLAAALASIGVFTSGITRNQVVAYLSSWALCFALFMAGKAVAFFPYPISEMLHFIGFDSHVENISRGVLDTRDIVYFCSISMFFLVLLMIRLEKNHRRGSHE